MLYVTTADYTQRQLESLFLFGYAYIVNNAHVYFENPGFPFYKLHMFDEAIVF